MGLFDLFRTKKADCGTCRFCGQQMRLGIQVAEVQRILTNAFDRPGPLYNDERRQIRHSWVSNFIRNLNAAVGTLESGEDMRGRAISRADIANGLGRMYA